MGSIVYNAFSVNVQDNTTTTDGAVTVTQGKLEGLSLSSISFDGTDDVVKSSGTTDIMNDKDATLSFWIKGAVGSAKTILESNNPLGSINSRASIGPPVCPLSPPSNPNSWVKDKK